MALFCSSGATTIEFLLTLCLSAHKAAALKLRLTILRFISLSYPLQIGFLPRKLAKKLSRFQILALTVEVVFNIYPNEDQVTQAPKLAHNDCNEMTGNSPSVIKQVQLCQITLEELEISKAKIVLYTKLFRKELNATKCRVQNQQQKWHCGQHDHSSIDHTFPGIEVTLLSLKNNVEHQRKEKRSPCPDIR